MAPLLVGRDQLGKARQTYTGADSLCKQSWGAKRADPCESSKSLGYCGRALHQTSGRLETAEDACNIPAEHGEFVASFQDKQRGPIERTDRFSDP